VKLPHHFGGIWQQTQKMHVLPHYAANQTVKHYNDTQSNTLFVITSYTAQKKNLQDFQL
jgi:hypothetical protein